MKEIITVNDKPVELSFNSKDKTYTVKGENTLVWGDTKDSVINSFKLADSIADYVKFALNK